MATASEPNHPLFSWRKPRIRQLLAGLFVMLVCMLGLHTGASAFEPGKGRPPGVPDVNHPGTKIIVVKDSSYANGIEQNTVTAKVVDSDGNPVSGAFIAIFVGTVSGGNWTGADGTFTYSFGSLVPGDREVEARVNGIPFKKKELTYFKAPPPDVTVTTTFLDDLTSGAKANNTAVNEVYAHITDKYGNPLKDAEVEFTIASGVATNKTPFKIKTDASGNAYLQLVSMVAGTVTVTATVSGVEIVNGKPATVQFVADDPAAAKSWLQPDDPEAIANHTDFATVKATIVDNNGNRVKNFPVRFSIQPNPSASTAELDPLNGIVYTDQFGVAIIKVRSTKIGTANIIATVNGVTISNGPQVVKFIADVVDPTNPENRLFVLTNKSPADGSTANIVRAIIRDANGNPVQGAEIKFSIQSGIGTLLAPTTTYTDASGHAVIRITSTVAGIVEIYATVNGVPILTNNPASVEFVADKPSAAQSQLFEMDKEALANDNDFTTVRAHIVDANGNPVDLQEVVFAIESGGTATTAHLDPADGKMITDMSGDAIIKIKSPMIGTARIVAYVNGAKIAGLEIVTFKADVPSADKSTLVVLTNHSPADGTTANRVRAVVRDALGNPVVNEWVEFSIVSGDATFKTAVYKFKTDGSGHAIIELVSTKAGESRVVATINGITILAPDGQPAKVIFVADAPSSAFSSLHELKKEAIANNTDVARVRAHVVDINGNPVNGAKVNFYIDGGTAAGTAILEPLTGEVTTGPNGDAIIEIKNIRSGTVIINASVSGSPITIGKDQVVKFVADVVDVTKSYIETIQDFAKANGTAVNIIKVHAFDANGNPIEDGQVQFIIDEGDAQFATTSSPKTLANGEATVSITSKTAGKVKASVTVDGKKIDGKSPAEATFVADDPDVSTSFLIEVVKTAPANGQATTSVRAHIVDANGNPVALEEVEFLWTGAANAVDDIFKIKTDVNGDAVIQFTSTIVGQVFVTAKIRGNLILNPMPGGKVMVEFTVDKPSTSNPSTRIWPAVSGVVANNVALNEVRVHIEDAKGNVVPMANIEFEIVSGIATPDGPLTVTTDANGEASLFLRSKVAGTVEVQAKVNGELIVNGKPCYVIFVAGDPDVDNNNTLITPVVPKALANDIATTSVKAHLADEFGNPVAGVPVTFLIVSGTATIKEVNPVVTDANGDAIITMHSAVVGEVQVTAFFGSPTPIEIKNGKTAKVEFVLGPPDPDNDGTYIVVVDDMAEANDTELNKVKVHVVDGGGHLLKDARVVFTITKGTATIVETNPVLTNADGEAFITLHSKVAGTVDITATVEGIPITKNSPAIATFVAGIPEPTSEETELVVVVDSVNADGVATNILKARVADVNGNPVAGVTIAFTVIEGGAKIVEIGPFITDDKGEVIIHLTSTVGGAVKVAAKFNGVDFIHNNPAPLYFTSDPDVTNPETKLVVVTNNAIADGIETNSVKAHVVDANGAVLGMKEVFFRIESGDAMVLTVQPVLTDANGDATILLASKTAGSVSVTAKVGDKPIVFGSPAKLRFVPVDIYVPKVFTPNNDGSNDIAKPIVVGLTTFHYFSIYNRWGNLLFTTKDPNAGWDGRFKGVLQPVETYLWIAEGLDRDKKKVVRKGMISLVR